MNERLDEDWLDKRLGEEAPYIDDDGFTSHVVHALPARRASHWLRVAILFAVAVLASVGAYFLSGRGAFLYEAIARVGLLPAFYVYVIALASGALVMLGSVTYTISKLRGPQG